MRRRRWASKETEGNKDGRERERKREQWRGRARKGEDDERVGRITMQLFSFQLVNGF